MGSNPILSADSPVKGIGSSAAACTGGSEAAVEKHRFGGAKRDLMYASCTIGIRCALGIPHLAKSCCEAASNLVKGASSTGKEGRLNPLAGEASGNVVGREHQ